MYLHHLDLAAIGPYPGHVAIDFGALGASGVFLLEGPTGSGKSTIIDAVVFALYGKLASQESSDDRLYSQHAAPGTEPYVDLVFETGAGVFRVRRTPPFDRPKQRGSGTTRQNTSAMLWRLTDPSDPVGEPVSDRAQEVGAEITRIVGLDRTQFVQTVVLPQGEFARFLRSPGEDRRALLQSLFGTEVYERTTDVLVERRRAAAASVERADTGVRDALNRFAQATGRAEVEESTVSEIFAEVRAAADRAEADRAARQADATARRAEAEAAERRTAALARRADLLARRERLDEAAPDTDSARARLEVADRAARIVGLLSGLDSAGGRLQRRIADRESVLTRHARALTAVGVPVGGGSGVLLDGTEADVRPESVAERAALLREQAAGARHLVAVESGLAARRRALVLDTQALAEFDARSAQIIAALDARPVERAVLVTAARTASEQAATAGSAEQELADAEQIGHRIVERDAAESALQQAAVDLRDASTAAAAALHVENDLRTRRIAGLAGELGKALGPEDACPVCGSHEHPRVAVPREGHPSPEDIERAADARAEADAAQNAAAAHHAVARREHERLVDLVGSATAESVLTRIESARERIDAARAAASGVATAEHALAVHDRGTRALEADRADVAEQRAAARSTLDAARSVLRADAEHVTDGLSALADAVGPERLAELVGVDTSLPDTDVSLAAADLSLAAAVVAVEREAAALTDIATAVGAAAAAEHEVAERSAEVEAALHDLGFPDADAARDGALLPAEAAPLRAVVAAADRESTLVVAGFAEPEVVAAEHDSSDAVDLDGARVRLRAATEALDAATGTAATALERRSTTDACRQELERAQAARERTSAESRAVVRLADIASAASGVNPSGITLGTYVLMRRFEDVVAAANDRLRAMLGGRFSLETSVERESSSRARRTGLALAVRDHATDRTRDPRSLSGGETFTASLCLALGLADVVQAEAGGVELGTLFVDEGFGTLDPETLDDVIGQLTRLTAGGRQVGIVSHVEELKQRIPDRIEVRRVASGGSVVTTTA